MKVNETGLMISRCVFKGRVILVLSSEMIVLVTNKQPASRMTLQVLFGKDDGPIVLGRVALDQSLHCQSPPYTHSQRPHHATQLFIGQGHSVVPESRLHDGVGKERLVIDEKTAQNQPNIHALLYP